MENPEDKKPPVKELKKMVVKTYTDDMAGTIEYGAGNLIKKIIENEEEHEIERENLSPESKKNKAFMIIGAVCVTLAVSLSTYFLLSHKSPTVYVAPQFVPLIFNDKSNFLEVAGLNKDDISDMFLLESKSVSLKQGGIEGVYFTYDKQVIGLRKFIGSIESFFKPGGTTFVSDSFLMGFMNNDTSEGSKDGRDMFILMKVRSMSDVFESMRAWENKMFYDLHGFLDRELTPENSYLLTKNFEDGIVQNKNARILYDKDGKIVMMYVFANDSSVVVTVNEKTTSEIMIRLSPNLIK